MSFIVEVVGRELSELYAFEFDQSIPNLATVYMLMRSCLSLIMGQIESEYLELFALEFGKMLNMTVYALSSTNNDHTWSKCMRL